MRAQLDDTSDIVLECVPIPTGFRQRISMIRFCYPSARFALNADNKARMMYVPATPWIYEHPVFLKMFQVPGVCVCVCVCVQCVLGNGIGPLIFTLIRKMVRAVWI